MKDLPNVFGIADDILIVEYDAHDRDHDRPLETFNADIPSKNIKLNKNKFHFICTKIQSIWEVIPRGVQEEL